jgi:hypothetical protein
VATPKPRRDGERGSSFTLGISLAPLPYVGRPLPIIRNIAQREESVEAGTEAIPLSAEKQRQAN